MTAKRGAGDPQTWAVALVRWCLGLMLLLYGLHKLPDVRGFAQNYVLTPLGSTWLPKGLLMGIGLGLPFLEIALGTLLVLGVARNVVLIATGLYLITLTFGEVVFTLTFGQTMLMQPPMVFQCFMYVVVTATLLFLHEHDRWILGGGRKKETPPGGNGARINSPS